MGKMNSEVTAFFKEAGAWILATCGDKPNVTTIGLKKIDADGNLVLWDVFMKKNKENISKNPNVAVLAFSDKTFQSFQVKGTAVYSTDAALIKEGDSIAAAMKLKTKGAVIVTVKEVFVQTPGPDNNKQL